MQPWTSTVPTQAYLERCDPASDSSLLHCLRTAEAAESLADWSLESLHRPFFAESSEMAALCADMAQLHWLLGDIADRYFGGPRPYLEAQGVAGPLIDIILEGAVGATSSHLRPDIITAGGHAKIIELNCGSALGAIDISLLNEALLALPEFAEFAREHGLEYADTLGMVAGQLSRAGVEVTGGQPPRVALIEESGARDRSAGGPARTCRSLRSHGLDIGHGELGDLSEVDGRIYLNGDTPIDVVFRYFDATNLLASPADRTVMAALTRAQHNGTLVLFPPLDTDISARKATLGLLHDPAARSMLTPEERALVDRRIPWTRTLGSDFVTLAAHDRRQLIEECRDRREELVLKPSDSFRGTGVILGTNVTDRQWQQQLTSPQMHNYLVQQRVVPDEELVADPDTGRLVDWHVVWGIFLIDGQYGGATVRGRPAAEDGVIGARGTFRKTCGFLHREDVPAHDS
jgi:hypothetical protein